MFDDIPENYKAQTADNEEEGWRYMPGRQERAPSAGAADPRSRRALHRARDQSRAEAVRTAASFSISPGSKKSFRTRAEHIKTKAAEHVSPVQTTGRHRHHPGADGGRPDDALHDGRDSRRRRHADVECARACSPPANAPPGSMAPIDWAAIRFPTCWFSGNGPANSRRSSRKENSLGADRCRPSRRSGTETLWSHSSAMQSGENGAYQVQKDLQEMMQDNVGIVRREDEMQAALEGLNALWERARTGRRRPAIANSIPAGTPRSICRICSPFPKPSRARPWNERKAAARSSARIIRTRDAEFAKVNTIVWKGADGAMQIRREPIPEMPRGFEASHRGDEMRNTSRPSESGAATRTAASFAITRPKSPKAWSCSTRSTTSRPPRRTTSPAAGIARPANAAPARRKSTACPS